MTSLGSTVPSIGTPAGTPTFVNLDEKYICHVCHNVCRDAMQTSCGHRLCKVCLDELFVGKTEPVTCPTGEEDCLMQRKKDTHIDPSGRRKISRLDVYCSFKEAGCAVILPWNKLDKHSKQCEYHLVDCGNEGCTERIPFKHLDIHMKQKCQFKPNSCERCGEIMPEILKERHLQEICRKIPVICPFQCGTEMLREDMEDHVKQCDNRIIECKFKSIGCDFRGTVKQVTEHMLNDVNTHLEKIKLFTGSMDLQSWQLRNQLEAVTSERDSLRNQVVELKGEVDGLKGTSTGLGMDLRFQVLETQSYDGTLLWKLRDYTRRKAEAIAGKTLSLYSQPFYTHPYGYKMCARVYLNGDGMGKGSHLSLFFVVMRGEYDNLLKWPFPCKVTMILLDQETKQSHMSDTFRPDPNSSSFRKPAREMNIALGCPLFISHNVLETRKFIQDDILFIKIKVDIPKDPYYRWLVEH